MIMEYVELNKIPNYDFDVTGTMTCVLDNKIILGGGSGFSQPLSQGGKKCLNDTIKLLTIKNNELFIIDQVNVELNYSKYGFSNGASIVVDKNTMYYFAGLKVVDNQIINSKDVIEVKIINEKIVYKIYENVLPFEGEAIGVNNQGYGYILASNNLYKINFNAFVHDSNHKEFLFSRIVINENINGALLFSDTKDVYLLGGYKPYDGNDINESNIFYENQIIKILNNVAYKSKIHNFDTDPPVFFGASSIYVDNNKVMIIGGVNKDVFLNAIYNFSILKDDELETYKKKYFNMDESEFNFNKEVFIFDLKTFRLKSLGTINHGLAGNPALIKYNEHFYILNGEIKAGVRLVKPIKLIF